MLQSASINLHSKILVLPFMVLFLEPLCDCSKWELLCSSHRYTGEIKEPRPFFHPGMRLILRVFRVFPEIKITMVQQVRMSPTSAWMYINMRKTPHSRQRSWTHLFFIHFVCVVSKNPKAWDHPCTCICGSIFGGTPFCGSIWVTLPCKRHRIALKMARQRLSYQNFAV